MSGPPLNEETLRRLNAVFPTSLRAEATRLLEADCGYNVSPRGEALHFERLRIAAIKLSKGRIAGLYDAIAEAQTDWRDLLMAAGFGHNAQAHLLWDPSSEG